MATIYKVDCQNRMPLSIGVQEENLAHGIQFDITPWIEEHGAGAVTANAQRPTDAVPYPVIVQQDGNIVTWRPKTADVAIEGTGAFQLIYTVGEVVARTRIWATNIGPSLIGAGDPPDPFDDWLDDMREVAADALQSEQNAEGYAEDAEAWAVGTKGGVPVTSGADQYENNAKYYSEESYKNAEAWAVGQRGGVDVPSSDVTYENNAKYYSELAEERTLKAFPVGTASGSIASFTDGADDIPVKSLKIGIEPKQAGSGTPSPSNVRAITGWTGANVYVTGFNQWDEEWETGVFNTTTGANLSNQNQIRAKNRIPVLPNTEYYINTPKNAWVILFDADGNVVPNGQPSTYSKDGNSFACGGYTGSYTFLNKFTTPSNARYMRFYCVASYGGTYNNDICINLSDTAKNGTYEPYEGTTYPISFSSAGTVYGGEVDVTTGVLTVDKAMVDLSTLNWVYSSPYSSWYAIVADVKKGITGSERADCMAEKYATKETNLVIATDNTIGIRSDVNYTHIWCRTTGQSVSPSGNFVYPLETPTTYQLTPTEVRTLLGDNNVWADTGDTDIEYRKDPTLALEELANAIVALGGNL